MKHSHVISLFITLLATLLLSGCFSGSSDVASALVSTDNMQLIDSQTVYPNPQDTADKEDRVYYTVEVYQDKDNTILVQADSNFKLFEKTQYTVDFDQVLTKADVSIRWTTLMGSTEATQDDELAIADISLSHGGTVFSEKKINFVTKAIDIVVDGIEKNS
ncbi:hypothetical protein [Butyricicoccus intestinisimiae]|uniref:Uncharacterized protein n=1 Tax=Butyricicoccus intestinisimiae TaxID=2841509 RepID=A0ABS6EQQ8_9FIRM|nr:hypothetical protein [Butyricicoccus intestinisimiae]MBU5490037.1 hypothetical protein [Butyricicoccus intestinisimiae]